MKHFTAISNFLMIIILSACQPRISSASEISKNQNSVPNTANSQVPNFCQVCKCKVKVMIEDERVSSSRELLALIPIYLIGDTSPFPLIGKSPILFQKSAAESQGLKRHPNES